MSAKPDTDQATREAISGWIKHHDDEEVIVLNYVTVAEVVGPGNDGEPWLKILSNRGLSSWARLGMAHALVQTADSDLQAGWYDEDED